MIGVVDAVPVADSRKVGTVGIDRETFGRLGKATPKVSFKIDTGGLAARRILTNMVELSD